MTIRQPAKTDDKPQLAEQARLEEAAGRAAAAHDWEQAIAAYTQAIDIERGRRRPSSATLCRLLDRRAECHRMSGAFPAEAADLDALIELAEQRRDAILKVGTLNRRAWATRKLGELVQAQEMAGQALSLGRSLAATDQATAHRLQAMSLGIIGNVGGDLGEIAKSEEALVEALQHARDGGDAAAEAFALWSLAWIQIRIGRQDEARTSAARTLDLYRALGDREGEGNALNACALTYTDYAVSMRYTKQALAAFEAAGNVERQAMAAGNLAFNYMQLGLYGRACADLETLAAQQRAMQASQALMYTLDNLAVSYLHLGETTRAVDLEEEAVALSLKMDEPRMIAGCNLSLGMALIKNGQAQRAAECLRAAAGVCAEISDPGEANCLAWLGAAQLAMADRGAALATTARAIERLEATGATGDFPVTDVWWWRYQALARSSPVFGALDKAKSGSDAAWQALDQARAAMLRPVATLSDDGLRRCYFGRVSTNRQIVSEWLRQARARGLSLNPLSDHLKGPGGGQEPFERLIDIGVRLNGRREAGNLPRFIIDEVIELTGAERAVLILLDDQGRRQVAAESGLGMDHERFLTGADALLAEAAQRRAPLLRFAPDGAAEFDQRSILCVPLIAAGTLDGFIYADLQGSFGRFNAQDRDLLSVLANQAAVAVENATWAATLERRVSERTAELSLINSVQQGLASRLDFQEIVDLVGDKIHEIFDAQVVSINLYDRSTNMLSFPYAVERGQRYYDPPMKFSGSGLSARVIATRQPLLINSGLERVAAEIGSVAIGSGEMAKSYIGLPILAGNDVIGVVDLQNLDREDAFSESDVRLLTTLANSMGVALENARLFEETRRLLEETQQRSAELSVISSVSQGLVSQLDFQAIIDLVGDKVHEIFGARDLSIRLYDPATDMISYPYIVESGQRLHVDTEPLGATGFACQIIRSRQPLVINSDMERLLAQYGSYTLPGTVQNPSFAGVPIVGGEQVTGVITLESPEENAFPEASVRLLTTLASNLGVALQNAHLFDETKRLLAETRARAHELGTISAVGQMLGGRLDMQGIYELVGDKLREIFDAQVVTIIDYDRESNLCHWPFALEKGERLTIPPSSPVGFSGHILKTREPLLIKRDLAQRRAELSGSIAAGSGAKSYLGIPMIAGGEATGVISLQNVDREDAFDEHDLGLLTTLAHNVSVSIENARLYQKSQQRASQMATVAEVGRELSATLDLNTVLESVAGHVHRLFEARDTVLRLVDADGMTYRCVVALGKYAQQQQGDVVMIDEGIHGFIAQTGMGEIIDDVAADPRGIHVTGTPDVEDVVETLMCAPLIARGSTIGLLSAYRDRAQGVFSKVDLDFLVALARQAAIAIENARLYAEANQQRQIAEISQRRMADIIDFLPDATVVIDREGKVIAWNHAIEEMTGVTAKDMLGKGDHEYALPFYGERRPILIDLVLMPPSALEQRYAQIERDGDSMLAETYVPGLSGGARYLSAAASVLRDSSGNTVGAIELIRDISDRKQAEEELRQAKEAAESATQAKSAFLAMMSHEIRTPMNAIIGMSGLLLDTQLTADQRDFADTIRSSGDALLTIINDILDFSKIEAGKLELEEQPFDLRECVESSLELLRLRAAEKGLELAYQIDAGVPSAIISDVTRLRQIMVNLLSNAVKFTEKGEVLVTVTKDTVAPSEKCALHFSVHDTGIGIAPDRIGRLFQAFTQADASTSRRYGGTGLGLAISKRLSELMGGRMWAESEGVPGKGSTFHFTIVAQATAPVRESEHLRGEQPQLRGRRVLIVDDNATNRRIVSLQARSWGMLPRDTESAGEALAWIDRGDPFDVAILDMHMPEMDGIALAQELHKRRSAGALPLVLTSSLGPREAGAKTGEFAAYLVKPIRSSALFNVLMGIFAAEQPAAKSAPVQAQADTETERKPLRILLAEDNAVNQKLAMRLLSQMGYRADVAANGLEVIQAVERQRYDVILMDVQMPEMDGLEATRRICGRWDRASRPHIIAMTANAMQGDREMCLEAGMDDYLSKPIRVPDLAAALGRVQPQDMQS